MAPVLENLKHLPYDEIQFTLVDCLGHASLIKTVLGGAQIIDVMMLVDEGYPDADRGVPGGGRDHHHELLAVMNKTDMIPRRAARTKSRR